MWDEGWDFLIDANVTFASPFQTDKDWIVLDDLAR
jgi:hypothetical protein